MKRLLIGERVLMLNQLVEISPLQYQSQFILSFSNGEKIIIAYKASQQRSDLIMFLDNNSKTLNINTI